MAPSVESKGQITVILPERQRYKPLGAKIRKIAYELPQGFDNFDSVYQYLRFVQEEAKKGNLAPASDFYQTLGLSTANIESFKSRSHELWGDFRKTVFLIADKMLGESYEGRQRAFNFLRPLAYDEIPEDPDHVWGYPLQTVNDHQIPASLPFHCAFGSEGKEDGEAILDKLTRDLLESYERRNNPGWRPASDQCHEPHQPMRYRLEADIDGPTEVDEGGEVVLEALETSVIEYGERFQRTQNVPVEREWNIDEYTCQEPPTVIETASHQFAFRAPKVLHEDCRAVIRLTTTGPQGVPVVATHTIDILNSQNEAPTVRIEKRIGALDVKLRAKASDPEGDALTYKWEQIGGDPVSIMGGVNGPTLEFFNPGFFSYKTKRAVFRVTVTDQPKGKKAGTGQSTQATVRLTFKGNLADPELLVERVVSQNPKSKRAATVAKKTGGKPRLAKKEDLLQKIKEAVVPTEQVEFIDLVLVIDASGSMDDNIEEVRKKIPELLEEMKQKVKGKDLSRVRVAVVSYTDDRRITHLHLTPATQTDLSERLGAVIRRIRKENGSLETVWDALYLTIAQEQWRQGANGFRKVVYLTDAKGNTGKLGKNENDVAVIAMKKGVTFEPIFFAWEDLGLGGALGITSYFNGFGRFSKEEIFKNIIFHDQYGSEKGNIIKNFINNKETNKILKEIGKGKKGGKYPF